MKHKTQALPYPVDVKASRKIGKYCNKAMITMMAIKKTRPKH